MYFKRYLPNNNLYRPQKDEPINVVAEKFNTIPDNIVLKSKSKHYEGEFVEIKQYNQFLHVVKPLDNIDNIADKYKVSVTHIMECNNLNSTRLFIGQKLRF